MSNKQDKVHIMIETTPEKKGKFQRIAKKEGYTQTGAVREAVKKFFKVII